MWRKHLKNQSSAVVDEASVEPLDKGPSSRPSIRNHSKRANARQDEKTRTINKKYTANANGENHSFIIHDDDEIESAFIKSIDLTVHKPYQFEQTYNAEALPDKNNRTVIGAMEQIFTRTRFVKVNGSLDDSRNAVHQIRPEMVKQFGGENNSNNMRFKIFLCLVSLL